MMSHSNSLVEVKDGEQGTLTGYRCGVCHRFFGSQEVQEAQQCVNSHRDLLVEG